MGCTPTAQRLNSIPSCNVNASTRSTKSTVKNSDCMMSPHKLPLYKEKSNEKEKVKRYYSPNYVQRVKAIREGTVNDKKRSKGMSKQKQRQPTQDIKKRVQVKNLDTVSHLSLNSQYNSRQKLQFLQYEARTPQKKSKQISIEQKASSNQAKQRRTSQKQQSSGRKLHKQLSRQCYILQKELMNMNVEKFEKIKIDKREF